jgi:hypothetical protein
MTARPKSARVVVITGILFLLPAYGNAALIIDDFSTTSSATTAAVASNSPGSRTASATSSLQINTVTVDREVLAYRNSSNNGTNMPTVSILSNALANPGYLVLTGSSASVERIGEVVYEAPSASQITTVGANPNLFSLGLNLASFGVDIELMGYASIANTPVYITLYGANASTSASAVFLLGTTNTAHTLALSNFTGNFSNFSNVGAIRVMLGTSTASPAANVANVFLDQLRIVGTPVGAVPEPATWGMVGLALVGAGFIRRKA